MKKTISLLLVAWSWAAQGHVQIEDRRNEYDRQRDWQDVRIETEGVRGSLPGVLTESRQVLLDGAQAALTSKLNIESTGWGMWNRKSTFVRDCRRTAAIMDRIRARRNEYTITMPVIPLKAGFVDVVHSNGSRQKVSGPTNAVNLLDYFQVDVTSAPDSSIRVSRLDVEKLKIDILTQIGDQRNSGFSSGEIRFDLTSYDDVVCDLMNSKVTISITMNARLNRARLKRTPIFTREEIDKVSNDIQRRAGLARAQANHKVLGPAYLTQALSGIGREIDQLDSWEFERLFGFLADPISGRPLALSSQRKAEVAQSMDRIEAEPTAGSIVYTWDGSEVAQ